MDKFVYIERRHDSVTETYYPDTPPSTNTDTSQPDNHPSDDADISDPENVPSPEFDADTDHEHDWPDTYFTDPNANDKHNTAQELHFLHAQDSKTEDETPVELDELDELDEQDEEEMPAEPDDLNEHVTSNPNVGILGHWTARSLFLCFAMSKILVEHVHIPWGFTVAFVILGNCCTMKWRGIRRNSE